MWVENDLGVAIIHALTDFPGLKQLGCIRRTVYRNDRLILEETRYHVSSASKRKLPPKKFLRGIRGHWQIENGLHHVKDRSWYEDKMYSKRPGQGWILGQLRNQALNVLRILTAKFGWEKDSMPVRAARLQSQAKKTLKLMGAL